MSQLVAPTIELSGGPENPVGRKYVTNVSINPAFTDVDGVQYYQKIIKVADVDGEQLDDAITSNTGDDQLGEYTTAAAGTAGAGNTSFEIKLGDNFQAEDDFYNGYLLTVFPRKKDSTNDFEDTQRMIVMDYRSDENKILIQSDISSGTVVGQYKGTGSIADNTSYEFARITLDDFDLVGSGSNLIQVQKRSLVSKRFVLLANSASIAPHPNVYVGFKLRFTGGAAGDYLITQNNDLIITLSEGSGTNQMSDANYNSASATETVQLIPPDNF